MQGSNGRYSVQIGPFNEGTLMFHINARNTAGNIASTGEYMLFIDGTPPNVKVISPNGGEIFSKKIKIQWLVSDNNTHRYDAAFIIRERNIRILLPAITSAIKHFENSENIKLLLPFCLLVTPGCLERR